MSSPEAYVLLRRPLADRIPHAAEDVLVHLGRQVATRIEASGLSVVARAAPTPTLAALGDLSAQADVLSRLSQRLDSLLNRVRFASYPQVERDCEELAERLVDRVGRETLAHASFVGIPRGGLIAVGMLSYALDLSHAQLESSSSNDGPLVVVDDCALTGSRFRRFLREHPDREIIFAPLYAHPALCTSILQAESRVVACVNARDLHDYAPEEMGDAHSEWQAQWHRRHADKRYWIGRTEHLCFPWGEADTATWNPERERVEQGLSVVPPEYRLKTRPETDERLRAASDAVQLQPSAPGPIRPSTSVVFGVIDDQTIVAQLDAEVCLTLNGTAAAMWHGLVEHGTVAETVEALRQTYTADAETLRADLVDFIRQLASHDLLHVPDGLLS